VRYEEWEETVPQAIRGDALWHVKAYRLALFLSVLAWADVSKLSQDRRTLSLADQLYRAVCSIGANLAEGYSRGTGKDRARFYEYALGSARESRDWYYKGTPVLGQAVADHRMQILVEITRLLLTMVPQQRASTLREEDGVYELKDGNTE
jgi:four helix bundle protein